MRPAGSQSPHILIIVQNLPVLIDRRVWLECQALVANGYAVSVICPRGEGEAIHELNSGVHIYRYRPAPQAVGVLGFALEFAYSWVCTAILSLRVWQRSPFMIIQACNPPDTYWALARLWRRRGVRFVFDHHDLNPELFRSRFGEPTSVLLRAQLAGLLWLERQTFKTADWVISTNESYKAVAVSRGDRGADEVTVVRSGPDTTQMRPIHPAHVRSDEPFKLVYLGIMGPQDGVDQVLEVMHELVHVRGRTDVTATLMGFGDCLKGLRKQSHEMGLDDVVTFTGRVGRVQIAEHLSAADVGLCPDLKSPLNDVSTMNKTMEYMAYGLPSVSFDLTETRISGGDTVMYVTSGDVRSFADAVETVLDNLDLRIKMGLAARDRVARELDWRPQADKYVGVYDGLTGWERTVRSQESFTEPPAGTDAQGRRYVDLRDPGAFAEFVRTRDRHL